jgi:hypothetical protein
VLTGSVHHPCIIFFIFPVVFTSSKRFALHNVALASLPRASGSFGHNFASQPVVHLPFRNKSASAKGKVGVSGGGVRPLAAETSNWRSDLWSGVEFLSFRFRAPSGTRWGGEGKLGVGRVTVGWREGNGSRCLILQSLAAALAA